MAGLSGIIAKLLVKIGADTSGLDAGLGRANSAVTGFASSTGAAMKSVGSSMMAGGAKAMASGAMFDYAIGRKARAALQGIISDSMEFEAASKVMDAAMLDVSETVRNDLHRASLLIGADMQLIGIDAMEASEAITNFAKSGMSIEQMFGSMEQFNSYMKEGTNLAGSLRASIDLAAASDIGLGRASETVIALMSTYNMEAKDAIKITDGLVKAADASIAEVGGLADAWGNVGSVAAGMKIPMDDINTALAILSMQGQQGAEAGTRIKSMLIGLMRETKKSAGAWETLGTSAYDAQGRLRKLPAIFDDIRKGMAGLTEQQATVALKDIFGTYGITAAQTLLAAGREGWTQMEQDIEGAATAAQVGQKRTEGFAAAMEQLQGAIQTFNIMAGAPLIQNVLIPLVKTMTDVIGKLAMTNPKFLRFVTIALIVGAALGPLLMGFGGLATGLGAIISIGGSVVSGLGGIGGAIGGLVAAAGPVILVIAAVVAAIVGLYFAWKNNWLGIRDVLGPIFEQIANTVMNLVTKIVGFFTDLWQQLVGGSIIPDIVNGILSWFGKLATAGIALITKLSTGVLSVLGSMAESAYSKGKALATRFGEGVKNALSKALGAARILASKIRALLPGSDAKTGPLSDLFASGKALPTVLGKGIMRGMRGLEPAMAGVASSMAPRIPGSQRGDAGAAQQNGNSQAITVTVNNPQGEPTEQSIVRQLRNLAAVGVLNPI